MRQVAILPRYHLLFLSLVPLMSSTNAIAMLYRVGIARTRVKLKLHGSRTTQQSFSPEESWSFWEKGRKHWRTILRRFSQIPVPYQVGRRCWHWCSPHVSLPTQLLDGLLRLLHRLFTTAHAENNDLPTLRSFAMLVYAEETADDTQTWFLQFITPLLGLDTFDFILFPTLREALCEEQIASPFQKKTQLITTCVVCFCNTLLSVDKWT